MYYTVAIMIDPKRDMQITISRDNDKYNVILVWNWYGDENYRCSTRKFNDLKNACELFQLISTYFVYGKYSTNDRLEIFDNWKGENNNAQEV